LTALDVESVEDAEKKIAQLTLDAKNLEMQYDIEYERVKKELDTAEEALA